MKILLEEGVEGVELEADIDVVHPVWKHITSSRLGYTFVEGLSLEPN